MIDWKKEMDDAFERMEEFDTFYFRVINFCWKE